MKLFCCANFEPPPPACRLDNIANVVRKATVLNGIFRRVLAALLLALDSSHLLAQQRNPGVAPAGEQRAARVTGKSAYDDTPLEHPVNDAADRSFRESVRDPKNPGEPKAYLDPSPSAVFSSLALTRVKPLEQPRALAPATVQGLPAAPNDLQRLAAGTVFRDCADCPEMVVIPPGKFALGWPDDEAGQMDLEGPRQWVAIPSAFSAGRYEVTRAQFARFAQESGHSASGGCFVWSGGRYEQDASKNWRNPSFSQTDNDPVVCVSWYDAKAYTEWLTKKAGKRYRLLTEAEWEYAARAGMQTARPWGGNAGDACRYANVADASAKRGVPGTVSWTFHECDDNHAYTAPVGSYQPNAFGLYDMMGNAWEWTEDCRNDEVEGAPSDSRDGSSGECDQRVLRGGSWVDSPPFVRYDFRFFIGSDDHDYYNGFRVARTDH